MAEGSADIYAWFQGLEGDPDRLKGESMDEDHPGEKGWIQIKKFNFGFGFGGKQSMLAAKDPALKGKTVEELKKEIAEREKKKAAEAKKSEKKSAESWGKSGALDFEKLTFSKGSDLMSNRLMEICHSGKMIPKVIVVACRSGGEARAKKIEFLRFIFDEVHVKNCKLNLANDGLPTEDLDCEYNVVKMETVWTDNAIGNRRESQPIGAG
jgi:type VI protein secretion system component Hcp